MRLAQWLHYRSVDEMEANLSMTEYSEWIELNSIYGNQLIPDQWQMWRWLMAGISQSSPDKFLFKRQEQQDIRNILLAGAIPVAK